MEGFVPTESMNVLYTDISACLLALANALEAKGVLTKRDIAEAAQERMLVLQEPSFPVDADRLLLLRALATVFETRPPD
jgi:hypothetical protein